MNTINILPETLSNKIAAGEVIERPASIVKELVDNAIDAKATKIKIIVKNAGLTSIEVIDNGIGMNREDAILSIEQHATSKIKQFEDLSSISSFGFRGEALASIASISSFTLKTKQKDSNIGSLLVVKGGEAISLEDIGCPQGTYIRVADLFFNVPARKKFLKSKATEEGHIYDIALMLALSRNDIAFELQFDNRISFKLSANQNLITRATLLFGKECKEHFLPINYSENDITFTGLITHPTFTKSSRKQQRFFVNSRPVVADELYNGIRDAFIGLIQQRRYPLALLYIAIDPAKVDINVHPAKKEIRFNQSLLIKQLCTKAILASLRNQHLTQNTKEDIPSYNRNIENTVTTNKTTINITDKPTSSSEKQTITTTSKNTKSYTDLSAKNEQVSLTEKQETKTSTKKLKENHNNIQEQKTLADKSPLVPNLGNVTTIVKHDYFNLASINIIGISHQKYILAEHETGLLLIHQQAAQERVLFEKLEKNQLKKQALLLPINIDLAYQDALVVENFQQELNDAGIELSRFGPQSFIINAVVDTISYDEIKDLFFDLLDDLKERQYLDKTKKYNHLLKSLARKISKNKNLENIFEMQELIKSLAASSMPYTCPQGKPTLYLLSNSKLNRKFARKN